MPGHPLKVLYRWVSERDGKTCVLCSSLDGLYLDEDSPFTTPNGKWEFFTPPAHPHCRCMAVRSPQYVEKREPMTHWEDATEAVSKAAEVSKIAPMAYKRPMPKGGWIWAGRPSAKALASIESRRNKRFQPKKHLTPTMRGGPYKAPAKPKRVNRNTARMKSQHQKQWDKFDSGPVEWEIIESGK